MSYLVLARKYRPQKFKDLTGQETTAKILQSAILRGRVAQAYLFSGPRGIGKTTTARILAKALNCQKAGDRGEGTGSSGQKKGNKGQGTGDREQKTEAGKNKDLSAIAVPSSLTPGPYLPEPCGECSSCTEIAKGSSMDVLELDAASHTQVDKIREVVIDTVNFAPVRDKYKIFIIDEVHMLSGHSFNALLKTLEEPPPHVVFILATTDFHKIPVTIVSRCQRFRFLPLTQKEILETLSAIAKTENIGIEGDALSLIAKSAGGSMRDALSIFDQIISHLPEMREGDAKSGGITLAKAEEVLGVVREDFLSDFLRKIAKKDPRAVLEAIGELLGEGHDLSYFLKELREAFRQMLIQKCGYADENTPDGVKQVLPHDLFTLEELMRDIQMLNKCAEQMRWNDLPHVVFECCAVRLCQETAGAGEILRRIEKMEERLRNKPLPERAASLVEEAGPAAHAEIVTDPPERRSEPVIEKKPQAVSAAAPAISTGIEHGGKNAVTGSDGSGLKPDAAEPFSADLQDAWRKAMSAIQKTKPFLAEVLGNSSVNIHDGNIEIIFSRSFSMENVKRNSGIIEKAIMATVGKRVPLIFTLKEAGPVKDPAAEADGAGAEESPADADPEGDVVVDTGAEEESKSGESFEIVETPDPTPEESASEDAGTRNFLNVFPGKLKKAEKL